MAIEHEHSEHAPQTDRQLLARFVAKRDESAFREIVRRHGPLVLGVCRRTVGDVHEAEDAFQATFLVLARDARKIRRRRSLACWLHGVAYRISVRLAKRRSRLMVSLTDEPPESGSSVFEWIAKRHDLRMVDEELSQLSERDRESLTLRYLEGHSNNEIADILNISVSAVEGRLKRAKERLRHKLTRRGLSLGAFFGVLAGPHGVVRAAASLLSHTVKLGLMDSGSELLNRTAAHQLATTEMRGVAMSTKQLVAIAVVAALAVALGSYGLSGPAVGQDAPARILVVSDAPNTPMPAKASLPATTSGAGGTRATKAPIQTTMGRLEKNQTILATLDTETCCEFDDSPLSEVLDYLTSAHQVPIVIDRRGLDEVGVTSDSPITLHIAQISLRSALAVILDELDLDYVIRNEVLMITSRDVASQQLDPRIYHVNMDPTVLKELIPRVIAPDTWEKEGNGTIEVLEQPVPMLVIAQTDQIHAQIADFLEKLEKNANVMKTPVLPPAANKPPRDGGIVDGGIVDT